MMKLLIKAIKALSVILLSFVFVACSDTDGPAQDLIGTAATGTATQGMVYVVDAEGTELSRPINTDGSFKFDVRKLAAPFMLKTVADNVTDPDLYSFAEESNVTVNVTPLTNVAMYIANGNADPVALYDGWSSSFGNITAAIMKDAKAVVNANLRTQFTAFGFDPLVFDFIGTRFAANGTGLDSLLGTLTVDIAAGVNVDVTGIGAIAFDTGIDITGYDIGGTSVTVTGNYSLSLSVSVNGSVASAVQLSINLPAADLPTVGNAQLVEDMFVSYYGTKGTIVFNTLTDVTGDAAETIAVVDATITTTDGDVNYIATYTYKLNP